MFYLKLREITDEFDKLKLEQNEFKNRLEKKENDEWKFISKIRSLENIINTSIKTSESEQFVPQHVKHEHRVEKKDQPKAHISPIKSIKKCLAKHFSHQISCPVELANLNEVKPLYSSSKLQGILTNKKNEKIFRSDQFENILNDNAAEIDKNISNKILQTEVHTTYEYRKEVQNYSGSVSPTQASTSYNQPIKLEQKQTSISKSRLINQSNIEQSTNESSRTDSSVLLRTGVPVANRRGRRAKSFETWLDHRPCSFTKLGSFSLHLFYKIILIIYFKYH
jgi:hypothetical protein